MKTHTQRGFTLLLAALVASIVLSLGGSIFLIAQKQLTLSSLGRDSQFAFYAADTGAECALYWDLRHDYFATSAPSGVDPECDGTPFNADGRRSSAPYTMTFQLDLFTEGSISYCAQVEVSKKTSSPFTVIHADGYSVPCAQITASPRALQRSVELRY